MATGVRKSLRFPPDEGSVAWIDLNVREDKRDFRPSIAALVTDEALTGCGLVALSQEGLGVSTECMVQVGDLAPLKAQIRWIEDLTDNVIKIGVVFLE
jgi:hypothetical protein